MKIAILYDVKGWAYHSESLGLKKFLTKHDKSLVIDLYSYPDFYEKINKEKRQSYDCALLYPRQAKNITYNPEKTAVRFSSFGDYSKQKDLNTCDFGHFICMNKQIEELAKNQIPSKKNIISHIPVAVDTEIFKKLKNKNVNKKLVVGFAGNKNRKNDEKGYLLIEKAINELGNKIDFKFALYDKDNRISQEKMPEFYNQLDLIVCMSKQEGGPLPPFEAGACGVPTVLGCKKSAIYEILEDNVNGFLVDRTIDSLSSKILEINDNRDTLEKCSKNIEKNVLSWHSWSKISLEYLEIFKNLKDIK